MSGWDFGVVCAGIVGAGDFAFSRSFDPFEKSKKLLKTISY